MISVREFILQNIASIRKLLPSETQIKLINIVRKQNYVTSVDLGNKLNITVYNANNQLYKLYIMGWLERTNKGDPSGGKLYEYYTEY